MPTAERPKMTPLPRASKSTEIAFMILEHLDHLENGAGLAGMAKRFAMPQETLRPYLNGLILRRKIYLDGNDRHYYLDPDGPPVRPTKANAAAIRSVLEQFAADTGRDIALAVLTTGGLRLPIYVEPRIGAALLESLGPDSAHCTAAGHALLSGRTTSYLRRYFARVGMPRFTEATPTSIERLLPFLEPGARGIWSARGQYCTEGACIAVLAHDSRYTANRFALTTSLEASAYQRDRHWLRDRLLQAAGELQPAIGPLDP